MNNETATKKITRATFKSFINKNRDKLFIRTLSNFDPMEDGVRNVEDSFHPVMFDERGFDVNTLGILGIWLTRRDSFNRFFKDGFTGIEVYNCCGHFIVAVKA
jgi:hypothetical protein